MKSVDSDDIINKIFQYNNDLLCIFDEEGKFIKLNSEWEKSLGYKTSELLGKPCLEFIHPGDIKRTEKAVQALVKNEEITDFSNRFRHKNRSFRCLQWRSFFEGNNYYASAQDITRYRQDKEVFHELRQSDSILRTTMESINDGLLIVASEGKVTHYNSRFIELFSLPEKVLRQMNDNIFLEYAKNKIENPHEFLKKVEEIYRGNDTTKDIIRLKNGKILERRSYPLNDKSLVSGRVWVFRDITEQRNNEDTIRLSEKKYRLLFENMTSAFALHKMIYNDKGETVDYSYVEVNPVFEKYVNMPAASIVGKSIKELFPKTEDYWIDVIGDVVKTGKPIVYVNYSVELDRYYEIYAYRTEKDHCASIFIDVTDRVKNNEILNKFKASIDYALDAVYWINEESGFDYVNEQACNMLGYSHKELMRLKIGDIDPEAPNDNFKTIWDNLHQNKKFEAFTVESKHKRKDGSVFPVELNSVFVWKDNKGLLISYVKDISERKEYETSILKNQKLLNDSQKAGNIGTWEYNYETDKMVYNDQVYAILGIDKSVETNYQLSVELTHPDDRAFIERKHHEIIEKGVFPVFEYRIVRPDKTMRYVKIYGNIEYTKNNKPYRTYGIIQDITEQKKAEEELAESELKLESIFRVVPAGIGVANNRIIVEVNPQVCKLTGYAKEELIGKSTRIFYPTEEEYLYVGNAKNNRISKEGTHEIETVWKRKDGRLIDVYLATFPIDPDDRSKGITFTVLDITESKKYKIAIERSEAILRSTIESVHDGILIVVSGSKVLYFNSSFRDIFDVPDRLLEIKDDNILLQHAKKKLVDPETFVKKIGNIYKTSKPSDDIIYLVDGRIMECLSYPLQEDSPVEGRVWLIRDITKKKKNEEHLQMFKASVDKALDAVIWQNKDSQIIYANEQACRSLGYTHEEILKLKLPDIDPVFPMKLWHKQWQEYRAGHNEGIHIETIQKRKDGTQFPVEVTANHIWLGDKELHVAHMRDITERKQYEEALKKRVLALTRPLDDIEGLEITDLFNIDDLQRIQDTFAKATGVASLITAPDGIPITKPSNFTDFCIKIRSTEAGEKKCNESDAQIGENNPEGLNIQPCLSSGLWNAGASIVVGGVHIANWLIGQVRNEQLNEKEIFNYADQLGLNRDEYIKAYYKVPAMALNQFEHVAEALNNLARELAVKAYQNVQQARFITEQEEAEKLLLKAKEQAEESEYFLQESQQTGNVGSYRLNIKTGKWVTTKTLNSIYGIDDSYEKNVQSWLDILHPDEREDIKRYYFDEVIGKRQPFNREFRIIRYNDGETRWVHGIGKYFTDKKGNSNYILGTVQDITQIKKTETELIKAKERAEENEFFLQESQRTGNIGSYKMNFKTGYWISTETLNNIFGIDDSYVKNTDGWLKIIHPDDREKMVNYLQKEVIEKRRPYNKEYRIIRKTDNEIRWLHSVGKLYFDNHGNLSYMSGIIQDITERKLIEEERRMMNTELEKRVKERTAQLQQAYKDLESFAYSVSHDLRAPLRHIDGFMNLLGKAINPTDNKIMNYIDKISLSSKNMSAMIDELLQFSRLGRTNLKSKRVNLLTIVREIVTRLKPDYAGRDIQWNIRKLPEVNGDPLLLKIAFENIISNAIKYTAKKDRAVIEIGQKENCRTGEVCLFIKDNGAGFDMTYKDKLFGVFQRLHRNEEFEGIGIGLANVKQIITKHKGTVDAESEINKGAVFYVTLPK